MKTIMRMLTLISFSLMSNITYSAVEYSLKDETGWSITTIAPGHNWYVYKGYYSPQSANQIVNVTEIDLNNPEYSVVFKYVPSDTLSHVASMQPNAVAGINGTYLEIVDNQSTSYFRTDGTNHRVVEIHPDNLYFWKHEGAFYYDKNAEKFGIEYGNNNTYMSWPYANVISGSPILIDNFSPVGETFAKPHDNIYSLPDEHPDKHQGIRHPRTAVALTADNKLLMITVDGRRGESSGMTAKELTQFLAYYFNPKYALNLDGGGSTTMWVKDSGLSATDVVNYPTDNNRFDHYGQRRHRNFLLITRTSTGFAGGNGDKNDPYIIETADHLLNIHTLDWSINKEPYFKLTKDIDMKGIEWSPINPFDPYNKRLHFDGNGHIIKNLRCINKPYASLFGVLTGSCKNLGLVDVFIKSTQGAGAFGGYIGLATPKSEFNTGILENCYSSGKVEGNSGVGGLVGNIGKPYNTAKTIVRNCYSTCEVIGNYINTSPIGGAARAGGLAGIVWTGGILENSYSTGTVKASQLFGAGGLVGYSDAGLSGCVAMNDSIIIKTTNGGSNNGKIGCAISYTHPENAQPLNINVWSDKNIKLVVDDKEILHSDFSERTYSYHGTEKEGTELNIYNFYSELNWDCTSEENSWAQTTSNGYPVHQWLAERDDCEKLDGHFTGLDKEIIFNENGIPFKYSIADNTLYIKSEYEIESAVLFDESGKLLKKSANNGMTVCFNLSDVKGIVIFSVTISSKVYNVKISNY